MRTRAIILAGGEGTRLSVLTSKRTKPAVPFGGKYRIIDFTLSNCVNSNLFDIVIIAQYRPHSLLEHVGAGGPWDLNREITGGVRIFTPYRALASGWFRGTADAIQQNLSFIRQGKPDYFLILSGDHIYNMNYEEMIEFHQASQADVTIATLEVPGEETHRFGILEVNEQQQIISFLEKPETAPTNLANMGVYIFNRDVMEKVLWEDHLRQDSSHDFGKDILPKMIRENYRLIAFPYIGYWVDVGTVESYWKAHMDLLNQDSALDLFSPKWRVYTREEIHPPTYIHPGATIENTLISNGCIIHPDTKISNSVISSGVHIQPGTVIDESIILNDCKIGQNVRIDRTVVDKRVEIEEGARIGEKHPDRIVITMIGKNSVVVSNLVIEAGAVIGTDIVSSDYTSSIVHSEERIQTRRLPNEV